MYHKSPPGPGQFGTGRAEQTVQTPIRLLIEESLKLTLLAI